MDTTGFTPARITALIGDRTGVIGPVRVQAGKPAS